MSRPLFHMIDDEQVKRILDEACNVLEKVGVLIENDNALDLLHGAGAPVTKDSRKAFFPHSLVEKCLGTAPKSITMYDRNGEPAMHLEGDAIHFNPGSSALTVLDWNTRRQRTPVTQDLIDFSRVTDSLQNLAAQSTCLISSDVPKEVGDRYRLFIALLHSSKPIVTGTFSLDGFAPMRDMLLAVRGSEEKLREKPLAIFDCCPTSPLKWSNLTCKDLMDCARAGIPAQIISMPMTGATSPGTIAGTLVQLTAEILSGIVIHQLVQPGAPVIWGGSATAFDMRFGTTPMGAMETMMIDAAYARIAKSLGLPTHAYMALSDSKLLDFQAGMETGMGAVMAALSGVNVISGPGMLDFESCQSLEKLALDNEICGMALRLVKGIQLRQGALGEDLYGDIYDGEYFLTSPTTLRWLREEFIFPSELIERESYPIWLAQGGKSAGDRAHAHVREMLSRQVENPFDADFLRELTRIMSAEAKRYGADSLPTEGTDRQF
ncbi:MAG: trimethylamine methyltransferase family protein [Candidatus Zhuqueibacterota bacterium]